MDQQRIHLKNIYKVGEERDFTVRLVFTTYVEMIDEATGVNAYLHKTGALRLTKGKVIRCRITSVGYKHPQIELAEMQDMPDEEPVTQETLTAILTEEIKASWNTREFVRLLMTDETDQSFDSQCYRWILTMLARKADLHTVHHDCRMLLELSSLLSKCRESERDIYEKRLTVIIEQLDCYIKAESYISADGQEGNGPSAFVEGLLDRLRTSGYVYHPEESFNVLSSLFLLKPAIMPETVSELLKIIMSKDIKAWDKEPFRGALIKLLELYIMESSMANDNTGKDGRTTKNTFQALALQLLLLRNSADQRVIDQRLNASRLCTTGTYMNVANPEKLVDAAFFQLFHSKATMPAYSMEDISLLPYQLSGIRYGKVDTVNSYAQAQGRLTVSSDGIILSPAGAYKTLYPALPKELELWKNLQVLLPYKTGADLSGQETSRFKAFKNLWHDIEATYYNNKIALSDKAEKSVMYDVGDIVRISVIGQDEDDRAVYYCQCEDGSGNEGIIHIKEIVHYTIRPTVRHFVDSDGTRLVFEARVTDDTDGQYRFSLIDSLDRLVRNFYETDEEVICSVGGQANPNGLAPAITEDGIGISLVNGNDHPYIKKGTIVNARIVGPGRGSFAYRAEIIERSLSRYDLYVSFKHLMRNMAVGNVSETTDQQEEYIQESDRMIDDTYVREIISMIDRMATLETDYIKSYNYLGYARMLSMLTGWESQTAYFKGRMDVISMLHYFSVNSRIEDEDIAKLGEANAELYQNFPALGDKFRQLQVVSYLGKPEKAPDLLGAVSQQKGYDNLASLVLACNILQGNGMSSMVTEISNMIRQRLNLKENLSSLKVYADGEEGVEVEFKTSLVYSPESKDPAPEIQMNEILKVINSFLNTSGGTLYVGVNNEGYGVGLDDDLEAAPYFGDKDRLLTAIPNAVALKWGNNIATTYIESIGYDHNNTSKDVIIVKIRPHSLGIELDGYYYVRVGSTKRKLTIAEFDEYSRINRRKVLPDTVKEEVSPVSVEAEAKARPLITSREEGISTSRTRSNVLAEYMDPYNYEEPICFIKFLGGGKFQKTSRYDYDDNSLLTLAVKDSERDGCLVLAYANGHIVKVPVESLLKLGTGVYSRSAESRLMFATIASSSDAILTVMMDSKARSKAVMRLDRLKHFEEGRITDGGGVAFKENLMSHPIDFEIIREEDLKDYSTILDMSPKMVGWPVNDTTMGIASQLSSIGVTGLIKN